jgi:hypothetical protein
MSDPDAFPDSHGITDPDRCSDAVAYRLADCEPAPDAVADAFRNAFAGTGLRVSVCITDTGPDTGSDPAALRDRLHPDPSSGPDEPPDVGHGMGERQELG